MSDNNNNNAGNIRDEENEVVEEEEDVNQQAGGGSSDGDVDIDVDHGPSYGETLFWQPGTELPSYEGIATVQFDVDTQKLYDLYVKLMTQPPGPAH